jgi:hypothetical protein
MRRNISFIFIWDKLQFFSLRAAKNDVGIDALIHDFTVMGRDVHLYIQISLSTRRVDDIVG